ncbi:MAG: NAD(P)/FAD-dependent oxidoreductase [Chloroflexota bacterium]
MPSRSFPVLILGGGPAGMTAAIQLRRYGIPALLIEKTRLGGLLWNANLVENYPGFPAGVSGPKLVHLIEKQMERLDAQVTFDEVTQISQEGGGFQVTTITNYYLPWFVIVASGTKPNPISLPIPAKIQNRVFSEVYPLLGVTGKRVVIVGAGDAAFDYALNLSKNGNFVTILNRGQAVKCLPLLRERAAAQASIATFDGKPVSRVEAGGAADRLIVRCAAGESFEAEYLLFATGRQPELGFFPDQDEVRRTLLNGVFPDEEIGRLSGLSHAERCDAPSAPENLFFAGDVKNGLFRQAAIAAGDGLRAAMQIYFKLEKA